MAWMEGRINIASAIPHWTKGSTPRVNTPRLPHIHTSDLHPRRSSPIWAFTYYAYYVPIVPHATDIYPTPPPHFRVFGSCFCENYLVAVACVTQDSLELCYRIILGLVISSFILACIWNL